MTSVSCPKLVRVRGALYLHDNPKVASLALPSLVSVGTNFFLFNNPLLETTAVAVSPDFEYLQWRPFLRF